MSHWIWQNSAEDSKQKARVSIWNISISILQSRNSPLEFIKVSDHVSYFLVRQNTIIQISYLSQNSNHVIWCKIGVKTDDLDNLAAETCAYMTIVHPDYSKLAARIAISNLHKRTSASFFEVSHRLYTKIKDKVGRPAPMLAEDVYAVIEKHQDKIQEVLDFNRDYNYDYFGFKTLERSYLMKDGK